MYNNCNKQHKTESNMKQKTHKHTCSHHTRLHPLKSLPVAIQDGRHPQVCHIRGVGGGLDTADGRHLPWLPVCQGQRL